MRSGISAVKNHPLVTYYLLALSFTWAIEIPLALVRQGVVDLSLPFSIHYFACYGPLLAAIITTAMIDGSAGVRELMGRIFKYRVRFVWWLVAVSPIILLALVAVVQRVFQGEWVSLVVFGDVDFLPPLGLGAIVLWTLTYGLGEEPGWRGFLLPRLQKERSAFSATLILWILWSFWHAPAFFYVYDPKIIFGFLPGLLAGAIVFTWLYNSSGGSILMVIVFHGVFNFTTAAKEAKSGMIAAVISTLVIMWAVAVVFIYKRENLSRHPKHSL